MSIGERAEALALGVIAPCILGGDVELQRPFGAKLALSMGEQRGIVDNDVAHQVDVARLRVARTLVPVDVVPRLTAIEWAIGAALNDLMQVTNHELSSFATRGRHAELLDAVTELVSAIPPCRTGEEAVSRHATFSRALEVARTDSVVTWWTGSQSFRGQEPPGRLLAWPGLRNVQVRKQRIPLAEMAGGASIDEQQFELALSAWLACSPLSDLASAHRTAPTFHWSRHTVSLVSTIAGSNLALRAVSWGTDDDAGAAERATAALTTAAEALPEGAPRNIASQFAKWLADAREHWAETA